MIFEVTIFPGPLRACRRNQREVSPSFSYKGFRALSSMSSLGFQFTQIAETAVA